MYKFILLFIITFLPNTTYAEWYDDSNLIDLTLDNFDDLVG